MGLFNFKKSKKEQNEPQEKPSFFKRLQNGLARTRSNLAEGVANVFLGKKTIDDELFDELETNLLLADVGVETSRKIIDDMMQQVKRKALKDPHILYDALKQELTDILAPANQPLVINQEHTPYVIVMVGINGAGKTTTIGKLAKKFQLEGKSVMLAAGDTFRAAAVEQLQAWGARNNIPVMAQKSGADSASVIYDALHSARAKSIDILIADTAGRLHTQSNLMEELKKIIRVIKKLDETAPHEVMLVLDGGTGQNALRQAEEFNNAVDLTGITITKLDGTAKGGIVFAIAKQLGLPLRFIGVGESIDDLQPFDSKQFIEALFSIEQPKENEHDSV